MSNAPDEPTEAERTIFNAFYAPNHQRVRLSAIRAALRSIGVPLKKAK